MKRLLYLAVLLFVHQIAAQSFEKVEEMSPYKGFFNFYYDIQKDQIFIEVDKLDQEFIYVSSLAAGVGSNDLGLDRGQLGRTSVVKFIRAGNKLLLIQPNQKFRAITDNIEEKKSVQEAFAKSILFGFPIVEEQSGKFLIDATKFLIQDTHGVAGKLERMKQGSYRLDESKSAFFLERTKAFPKNVEFETMLTFTGNAKGGYIRSVTPNASFVTVRQHHSFVELPDSNYEKREFDTRSGAISISYLDYATPITSQIKKRYIIRHRLEKKDPSATIGEPVEPIVYYLDRGAPEPVKSALLSGGAWWNQAFEAAGYKNAFQIKVLPEGADPLDVRYNVVQWVHRSTRGWSYGGSVVDPRTGEILKGHVSLGSLRIRQDYLIAQALLGATEKEGDENPLLQMALARIRQLSAHEIGHTLGFAHNFAASFNNRASVMDYPHPYVKLTNNNIDLSEVYDTGIGAWDKVTVAYSYQDFPNGEDEKKGLNTILQKAIDGGLKFISDSDARNPGGAHLRAHLWDNGENAADELDRVLSVRSKAIENFSMDNIHKNEPLSVLEDVFVPLYFFHRYQVEAATKMIGGLEYNYAVKGDGQTIVKPVDTKVEKEALNSILNSLSVSTLKIPHKIVALFPPRAFGYYRSRESFNSKIGVAFDAINAPATAVGFTLDLLLHPSRVARMIQQKAMFENQLGLDEMIKSLIRNTFEVEHKNSYDMEVQQGINNTVLQKLLELAASKRATFQVKTIVSSEIKALRSWLLSKEGTELRYSRGYVSMIDDFYKDPLKFVKENVLTIPDGSPIGAGIRCDLN